MAKKKAARKKAAGKRAGRPKKKSVASKKTAVKRPKAMTVAGSISSLTDRINARSQEDYGFNAAGEVYSDITSWCSTSCVPLDVTLWGGFPRGRIIDIHGDPSQGKSSTMEGVFLGNQRADGENVLLMSESCVDVQRMQREGLDMGRFAMIHVESLEQGVFWLLETLQHRLEMPADYCRKHPLVIGWDTPSNAQEQHLLDAPEEQFAAGMASKARSVRSALRSITPLAGRLGVTIMLLFQMHAKIGSYYSGKDTDCGGGPKFNASLRLWARQQEKLFKDNNFRDRDIGIVSEITIVKSKAGCPPMRSALVPIRAWDGIDNDLAMFLFLQDAWVVDRCPACGGRVPDREKLIWESTDFQKCDACNRSGEVLRAVNGQNMYIAQAGKNSAGHATAWRYICGWPPEEVITFQEPDLRDVLDARPGLRTWMAEQCWRKCSKPTPAVFHQVE